MSLNDSSSIDDNSEFKISTDIPTVTSNNLTSNNQKKKYQLIDPMENLNLKDKSKLNKNNSQYLLSMKNGSKKSRNPKVFDFELENISNVPLNSKLNK